MEESTSPIIKRLCKHWRMFLSVSVGLQIHLELCQTTYLLHLDMK
jgi:hypothetical protein